MSSSSPRRRPGRRPAPPALAEPNHSYTVHVPASLLDAAYLKARDSGQPSLRAVVLSLLRQYVSGAAAA